MYLCGKYFRYLQHLNFCVCFADDNQTRAFTEWKYSQVRNLEDEDDDYDDDFLGKHFHTLQFSCRFVILMYIMKGIDFCWVVIRFQFIGYTIFFF